MKSNLSVLESISKTPERAADLEMRSDLAIAINDLLDARKLKQKEIADILSIPQPRVSDLVNEKIDKLSMPRLLGYLRTLGYQIKPIVNNGSLLECQVISI